MKQVNNSYRSASPSKLTVSEFRGIDLYNSPANVSPLRSPEAPNMIRDVPGKVRKRMGYHKVKQYAARINGVYQYHAPGGGTVELVHSGDKLYAGDTLLSSALANVRSSGWQLGGKLYISDGKALVVYDGESLAPASAGAYVPKLNISRRPSGGGTAYEGLNLLGDMWTESFLADGASSVYQLSYDGLDSSFVKVELMLTDEVWTEQTQGTHYSFDASLGRVTFVSAPAVSPADGADNVRVTVKKSRPEYLARINKCDMSVLYGVNGSADRLFVTGNPDFINYDWYSQMNDASYFPVSNYCILGLSTRVLGYSIIEDKLAAHKAGDADGRNVVLRMGKLESEKAAFPVVNTLQGAPIASGHSIAYLKTEPLFFSQSGVYAITPADANAERYTQNRSFFINGALEAEPDKDEACAVSFRDFYVLALGGKLYILDSLLKSYESGAPYSTHQYEAFLFTGINARVLYVKDGALRFGTDSGAIMEFYTDPEDVDSYNDEGEAIEAYWDTPMLTTQQFYTKKSFRYLALKTRPASETSLRVSAQIRGVWTPLFEESAALRYLQFSKLSFSKLSFSCDATPRAIGRKLRLPKVDKIRFRFSNAVKNEPFGVYDFAVEYSQGGRIR
ncbi:MAG: hypothetical protein Q4B42_03620 [Oscillospiraceae bacterium]|nr:hypothetical protein [Oscillospiraceae bacterium]